MRNFAKYKLFISTLLSAGIFFLIGAQTVLALDSVVYPMTQGQSTNMVPGMEQYGESSASGSNYVPNIKTQNYNREISSSENLSIEKQGVQEKKSWFGKLFSKVTTTIGSGYDRFIRFMNSPIENPSLNSIASGMQRIESRFGLTRIFGSNISALSTALNQGSFTVFFKQLSFIVLKTTVIVASALAVGAIAGYGYMAISGAALPRLLGRFVSSAKYATRWTIKLFNRILVTPTGFMRRIWKSTKKSITAFFKFFKKNSKNIEGVLKTSKKARTEINGWGKIISAAKKFVGPVIITLLPNILSILGMVSPQSNQPVSPVVIVQNSNDSSKSPTKNTANSPAPKNQPTTKQESISTANQKIDKNLNTSTNPSGAINMTNTETGKVAATKESKPEIVSNLGATNSGTSKTVSQAKQTSDTKDSGKTTKATQAVTTGKTPVTNTSLTGITGAAKSLASAATKLSSAVTKFASIDIPRYMSGGYYPENIDRPATPLQKATMSSWLVLAGLASVTAGMWVYRRLRRKKETLDTILVNQ